MADKKISQLDSASSVSSGAYFPISQSGTTYKGTTDQIGEQIATNQDFSGLNTTSKKIVGAINEVLTTSNVDILTTIDTPASVMTFNDGGDNIPVNAIEVAFEATRSGSGTATPSNSRAITGVTSATVTVSDGVTPSTYTASFGNTYYKGTVDLDGTYITHGYLLFDGSADENWSYSESGSNRRVFIPISGAKGGSINLMGNIVEPNPTPTNNYPGEWKAAFNSNATPSLLIGVDSSITSASDWKDFLSNNNLQIVYEYAAPIGNSARLPEIPTKSGTNQISADCGDIQLLEYFNENADEIAELHRSMSDDFHIYSTAEQIVGKWMGDDLYEKSYHYTQATVPAQATAVVIDNAISSLDLASLVDMTCVYKLHHTSQNYDVWYHGGMANTQLDFNTGNLLFYQKATTAQQNYSNLEVNITIRYTKSA